jgi:hypothetical protein
MIIAKIRAIADFVFDAGLCGRGLWVNVFINALDVKASSATALDNRDANASGNQHAHNDIDKFHALNVSWTAALFNTATQMEAAPC